VEGGGCMCAGCWRGQKITDKQQAVFPLSSCRPLLSCVFICACVCVFVCTMEKMKFMMLLALLCSLSLERWSGEARR
jgi:hypothetical protein